jgi:hypothetical protein
MKPAALLVVTLGLAACASDPTTPTNIRWDAETQARVITQNGVQSRCISPVRVYEIDGQTTSVSQQGFFLDGGTHSLKAQGVGGGAGCPVLRIPPTYIIPPLELDFEAGKTYYIGLDHSARTVDQWRVVAWKVE